MIKYLLETYVTSNIVSETEAGIMRLSEMPNKTLTEFSKLLWTKAIHCDRNFDEYVQESNFIEIFHGSISQRMLFPEFEQTFHYTSPGCIRESPNASPEWLEIRWRSVIKRKADKRPWQFRMARTLDYVPGQRLDVATTNLWHNRYP